MNEQTELLREMCELLRVIAEPALAKRDEKFRTELSELVGKSKPKAKAVMLMDGTRGQAVIVKEAGIDKGALSRLVKTVRDKDLISGDEKKPKLRIALPVNFFESLEKADE